MEASTLHDAVASLEKANANLEPELMTADAARALLAEYARAEKLWASAELRCASPSKRLGTSPSGRPNL